jgi:L,D-peptidoglycan transpeptidase YkuD (ErfK/YbiS/YcfS/YnhG family)
LFIGLDYPNLDYARQAYQQKRIDSVDYFHIRVALKQGRVPPQDTPLGGAIGIHGVGAGSAWVHANFDWTDGCVALDNQQIWRLAQWVQVGTRVEIR